MPTTITTANRVVAKIYGLWIKVEHGRTLIFINPESEIDQSVPFLEKQRDEKSTKKEDIFLEAQGTLL